MVFRSLVGGRPDVVAGEIDVLPPERRQVGEKAIGNVLGLAQGSDRAVQIAGVPQSDGRDEEVEAGRAVLLVSAANQRHGRALQPPPWRTPRPRAAEPHRPPPPFPRSPRARRLPGLDPTVVSPAAKLAAACE